MPFEIVESPNGDAHIRVMDRIYSPPEISAIVLQRLKPAAEEFLGDNVTEAIITVPAYFDDMQRQATRDAGKIAGLEVERIINEPTAAALAYGFGKKRNEKVAVYDLGGGTFDITILEINDGVFEVLADDRATLFSAAKISTSASSIGYWKIFRPKTASIFRGDRLALQRLKEAAERAKCELSSVTETNINLPFIAADASGPKHINATLTRAEIRRAGRRPGRISPSSPARKLSGTPSSSPPISTRSFSSAGRRARRSSPKPSPNFSAKSLRPRSIPMRSLRWVRRSRAAF